MHPEVSDVAIRDIHLPDAILWWPPGPGWWFLLFLCVAGLVALLWYLKRHKYRALQKAASKELDQLYQSYRHHYDARRFVKDLSVLLRRISITRYGSINVANLTGEEWLEFLDKGLRPGLNRSGLKFTYGSGRSLISVPYRNSFKVQLDVNELHRLVLEWVASLSVLNQLDMPPTSNADSRPGEKSRVPV